MCVLLVCKVIFKYQVILCGSGPNHNTHGTAQALFVYHRTKSLWIEGNVST